MKNLKEIISKGSKILSIKSPHEKIREFFEFLSKRFPIDGVIIFVWMPGYHRSFRSHLCWYKKNFKDNMKRLVSLLYKDKNNIYLPLGQNSYADEVLKRRQYLYVKDTTRPKYWGEKELFLCNICSTLTYPVVLKEHLKVFILFFSRNKDAFSEEFVHLINKFLDRFKTFINYLVAENKSLISIDLEKKLRHKNHELEILLKIARQLSFCSSYEDALLVLTRLLPSIVTYDFFVFIYTYQNINKIYIFPYYVFSDKIIEKIKNRILSELKKYPFISKNKLDIDISSPYSETKKDADDIRNLFWYPIESVNGSLDIGIFGIGRISNIFKRHEIRFLNLLCTQITISFLKIKEFYEKGKYILQNVLYDFPIGVILFDSNYRIVFFNKLGESYISKYGEITDSSELIFSGMDMEKFIEHSKGEAEIQVSDGKDERILNLVAYPMKGFSLELAWILFVLDVTEKRQAEQKTFKILEETVYSLSLAIESRDPYTAGHQRNVAELAVKIGEKLGLNEEKLRWIYMGALLHDLGKIAIPSEILTKPGKLMPEEFALIKTHPKVGYDILKDIEFAAPIKEMVLYHHERLDGSGYPHGLKGDDIPLEARILAVADVIDAISSHRPYRPALGVEIALDEVNKHKGVKYDEKVVNVCLAMDFSHFDFLKK